MNTTRTHRDPLILRQTLLDLAARLKSATASGNLDHQSEILDTIFHTLAEMGIGEDRKLLPSVIALALRAQRQCLRTVTRMKRDYVQKTAKRTEGILP